MELVEHQIRVEQETFVISLRLLQLIPLYTFHEVLNDGLL